ncbi:hypothetical protein RR46_15156 [Papilio xuthus]|uniref:Uncharacterized protein n=1 Tax=Papilio xuthus TaxID=66420 RepID=A0A194PEF6_PAPXU|nr:hypothetical protein RR46_15156 [Papilio xuthus]
MVGRLPLVNDHLVRCKTMLPLVWCTLERRQPNLLCAERSRKSPSYILCVVFHCGITTNNECSWNICVRCYGDSRRLQLPRRLGWGADNTTLVHAGRRQEEEGGTRPQFVPI